MKKLLLASIFCSSLCSVMAFADDITGYVSDAHCGAKHSTPSAANTKCVVDMCLNGGSDPVLVNNGKVMTFDDASKQKVKAFGGDNVKIDGSMNGNVISVNSIQKAP